MTRIKTDDTDKEGRRELKTRKKIKPGIYEKGRILEPAIFRKNILSFFTYSCFPS
jgi:hypothetical protein